MKQQTKVSREKSSAFWFTPQYPQQLALYDDAKCPKLHLDPLHRWQEDQQAFCHLLLPKLLIHRKQELEVRLKPWHFSLG